MIGIVLITTAAGSIIIPQIKNPIISTDTHGNIAFTVDYKNACTISVYEYIEPEVLYHHIDIDVEEKEEWKDITITLPYFSPGLHTFRLEAENSDNVVSYIDSLRVYVNNY